jgi:pimeloyl-ACP methyl ester carboxylesterase
MHSVTASDGTRIAYERHGDGHPVVLVHGTSGSRRSWRDVVPQFDGALAPVTIDRRGRGDSGDADEYALGREIEDVLAVVDAVDGTPTLFGHSFGGLCALEAARGADIERLVLYEPAILTGTHREMGLADDLAARLADGDRRGVLRQFFEVAGGVPDAEALPFWPDEVNFEAAETVVRENDAVEDYRLPAAPDPGVPVLLVRGEHSPQHLRDGVAALDDRIDDARLVDLDGVGHSAIASAPGRLVADVESFVAET